MVVFIIWPAPILSHLISVNSGMIQGVMNNKDIPITLEISKGFRSSVPETQDKDQTNSLLCSSQSGFKGLEIETPGLNGRSSQVTLHKVVPNR